LRNELGLARRLLLSAAGPDNRLLLRAVCPDSRLGPDGMLTILGPDSRLLLLVLRPANRFCQTVLGHDSGLLHVVGPNSGLL
jgi:hypothetical protein